LKPENRVLQVPIPLPITKVYSLRKLSKLTNFYFLFRKRPKKKKPPRINMIRVAENYYQEFVELDERAMKIINRINKNKYHMFVRMGHHFIIEFKYHDKNCVPISMIKQFLHVVFYH